LFKRETFIDFQNSVKCKDQKELAGMRCAEDGRGGVEVERLFLLLLLDEEPDYVEPEATGMR
jgi:hypothetical protein